VLFALLARVYLKQLTERLFKSKGLLLVKKGDFFSLFWAAWVSTFTVDLIQKAFKAVSVYPFNPNVILKRFALPLLDNSSLLLLIASHYSSLE
jgi:hypothetical protein